MLRNEKGQVAVLAVAALPILTVFGTLATSLGIISYEQYRLQMAADAAALGGATLWRQKTLLGASDAPPLEGVCRTLADGNMNGTEYTMAAPELSTKEDAAGELRQVDVHLASTSPFYAGAVFKALTGLDVIETVPIEAKSRAGFRAELVRDWKGEAPLAVVVPRGRAGELPTGAAALSLRPGDFGTTSGESPVYGLVPFYTQQAPEGEAGVYSAYRKNLLDALTPKEEPPAAEDKGDTAKPADLFSLSSPSTQEDEDVWKKALEGKPAEEAEDKSGDKQEDKKAAAAAKPEKATPAGEAPAPQKRIALGDILYLSPVAPLPQPQAPSEPAEQQAATAETATAAEGEKQQDGKDAEAKGEEKPGAEAAAAPAAPEQPAEPAKPVITDEELTSFGQKAMEGFLPTIRDAVEAALSARLAAQEALSDEEKTKLHPALLYLHVYEPKTDADEEAIKKGRPFVYPGESLDGEDTELAAALDKAEEGTGALMDTGKVIAFSLAGVSHGELKPEEKADTPLRALWNLLPDTVKGLYATSPLAPPKESPEQQPASPATTGLAPQNAPGSGAAEGDTAAEAEASAPEPQKPAYLFYNLVVTGQILSIGDSVEALKESTVKQDAMGHIYLMPVMDEEGGES